MPKEKTYRLRVILLRKVVEKAARVALKVALGALMAGVLFDQVLTFFPVDRNALHMSAISTRLRNKQSKVEAEHQAKGIMRVDLGRRIDWRGRWLGF